MSDFTDLTGRIGVATDILEASASVLASGTVKLESDLQEIRETKAIVVDAKDTVVGALDTANALNTSSQTRLDEADLLVSDLLASAAFEEAPKDGAVYGRSDGDWKVVGGGDLDAVISVNGKQGAVVLDASDVGALPSSYTPSYNDLEDLPLAFPPATHKHVMADITDLPTFGSLATKDDALVDGKEYVRKDGAWVEITSQGGGRYPVGGEEGWNLTEWVSTNPNSPAPFSSLEWSGWEKGRLVTLTGEELFTTTYDKWKDIPSGNYYIEGTTFTTGALTGLVGGLSVSTDGVGKGVYVINGYKGSQAVLATLNPTTVEWEIYGEQEETQYPSSDFAFANESNLVAALGLQWFGGVGVSYVPFDYHRASNPFVPTDINLLSKTKGGRWDTADISDNSNLGDSYNVWKDRAASVRGAFLKVPNGDYFFNNGAVKHFIEVRNYLSELGGTLQGVTRVTDLVTGDVRLTTTDSGNNWIEYPKTSVIGDIQTILDSLNGE